VEKAKMTGPGIVRYRLAQDIHIEIARLVGDVQTYSDMLDQLLELQPKYAQKLSSPSLFGINRMDSPGAHMLTDDLEILLTMADSQLQRSSATVKRLRDTLKQSGL
jgi:hypothetical protein